MDKKYMVVAVLALLAVPIALAHENNSRGRSWNNVDAFFKNNGEDNINPHMSEDNNANSNDNIDTSDDDNVNVNDNTEIDDDSDNNNIDDDFGPMNNGFGMHRGLFKHDFEDMNRGMKLGHIMPWMRDATITNTTVNGTNYTVITNNRNVTNSQYSGTQTFNAWINTDTNKIKSIDFEFHVDEVTP